MTNKEFEKCIKPSDKKHHNSVYEWFINQDHIPFDISSDAHGMYYTLYNEFLDELYKLYFKTGHTHYWYYKSKLVSTGFELNLIKLNSISIDKNEIRELKINQLIGEN
jgi:hypothetical protein